MRLAVRLILVSSLAALPFFAAAAGRDEAMRGDLAELPVGTGAGETCLENDLAATSLPGLGTPAPGAGHYYLVRGENVCATGSYGKDAFDGERSGTACP